MRRLRDSQEHPVVGKQLARVVDRALCDVGIGCRDAFTAFEQPCAKSTDAKPMVDGGVAQGKIPQHGLKLIARPFSKDTRRQFRCNQGRKKHTAFPQGILDES